MSLVCFNEQKINRDAYQNGNTSYSNIYEIAIIAELLEADVMSKSVIKLQTALNLFY